LVAVNHLPFLTADNLENTSTPSYKDSAPISDITTPGVISVRRKPTALPALAPSSMVAAADHLTTRWVNVATHTIAVPGASTILNRYPLNLMLSPTTTVNRAIRQYLGNYSFFRYKTLEVKLVLNSPKNVVGGHIAALIPMNGYSTLFVQSPMTAPIDQMSTISCYKDSVLIDYADNDEPVFSLPWSFRAPWLSPTIPSLTTDTPNPLLHILGIPVLISEPVSSFYVNATTDQVSRSIYVRFVGLEVAVPCPNLQSGNVIDSTLSAVLATATSAVGATLFREAVRHGIDYAKDTTCAYFPDFCDSAERISEDAKASLDSDQVKQSAEVRGHDQVVATQPNYLGNIDATPSSVKPMFIDDVIIEPSHYGEPTETHRLIDYLRIPQIIETGTFSSSTTLLCYGNPNIPRSVMCPNWFNYFAKMAEYWSGTIRFSVKIFSHPLVEVKATTYVGTPAGVTNAAPAASISNITTHIDVFSGSRTIDIDVPFVCVYNRLKVIKDYEATDVEAENELYTALCMSMRLDIMSCATPIKPSLSYVILMSAGNDFRFYSPTAFGATFNTIPVLQCRVPSEHTVHASPSVFVPSKDMLPLVSIEQLISIFSHVLFDCFTYPVPVVIKTADTTYAVSDLFDKVGTFDNLAYLSLPFVFCAGAYEFKVINGGTLPPGTAAGLSFISYANSNLATSAPIPVAGNYINPANGLSTTPITEQPVLVSSFRPRSLTFVDGTIYNARTTAPEPFDSQFGTVSQIFRRAGPSFRLYLHSGLPDPRIWLTNGNA
jgi:hypothetical protein